VTHEELFQILKATGLPVAYSHFPEGPPSIPYITFIEIGSENFFADDNVYKDIKDYNIELYTQYKEPNVEKVLEDLLKANELPFTTAETYIESEKLFQKIYEVRLI